MSQTPSLPEVTTLSGDPPRYPAGLRELGDNLYAWMLPNGSWGESNSGLIVGHGESLLVDTLWDLPHTQQMLNSLRGHTAGAPISRVVNTHSDGDHWWGNQLVAMAEIITSEAAAAGMEHDQPAQVRSLRRAIRAFQVAGSLPIPWRRQARVIGAYLGEMIRPFDFEGIRPTPATTTFSGSLRLEVGGREVRFIELGPAHTAGDLIVHVPDARTVYCGDILFLGATPVLWEGSVTHWIAALDRLLALDVDTVVPGHGPLTDLGGVQALRDYWTYLEAAARRRYEQGYPAPKTARDIALSDEFQARPFARWDCPERLAINVAALYRQWASRPSHLSVLERLQGLCQMALLAQDFPAAAPASLHGRD